MNALVRRTEKFATYFRDSETGLDYAQNRYHSPGQGRFLTPDPYMASGGPSDPGSWNRYAYVLSDPINFMDQWGLEADPPCPNGDCNPPPPSAPTGPTTGPGGGGEPPPLPPSDPCRNFHGAGYASCRKQLYENECVKPKTAQFVKTNIDAARALSKESGLPTDFILAWAAWESSWGGAPSPAAENGNFFGLQTTGPEHPDPGTGTGGWIGAVACKDWNPDHWVHGFACFGTYIDLYLSGHAALFSQNGRYLNAASAAFSVGGSYGDALQAIAKAGFNSANPEYGYVIMGEHGNPGTLKTIQKLMKDCGF